MISFQIFRSVGFLLMLRTINAATIEEDLSARHERNIYKGFSGYHLYNDSIQMVYFHDLTVAVVEIRQGHGRHVLLNCELIEVLDDEQRGEALHNLTSQVSKPYELDFDEITQLMDECDHLDPRIINKRISEVTNTEFASFEENPPSQSSFLSGIVPGTKWCGTGDIAKNYFDLGPEWTMDKCCRAHDLCPVKVRGYTSRYDLSNKSLYTKSHCTCDDELMKCLKATNKSAANLMGNIFFNLLRIPCLVDTKEGTKRFRPAKQY